jgi:hypothetical protein
MHGVGREIGGRLELRHPARLGFLHAHCSFL